MFVRAQLIKTLRHASKFSSVRCVGGGWTYLHLTNVSRGMTSSTYTEGYGYERRGPVIKPHLLGWNPASNSEGGRVSSLGGTSGGL